MDENPEKPMPKSRFYENYRLLLEVCLVLMLGRQMARPTFLHPHVFRKWFRTLLESTGVNKLLIDSWMGHNSGMVKKIYYLPSPEMMQAEIEKADKAMRIFGAQYSPL